MNPVAHEFPEVERFRAAMVMLARDRAAKFTTLQIAILAECCVARMALHGRLLAMRLKTSSANMTRNIDKLVDHGLLVREPHPDDARIMVLYPTDDGRRLVWRAAKGARA